MTPPEPPRHLVTWLVHSRNKWVSQSYSEEHIASELRRMVFSEGTEVPR
jgi:hypothetical protein